jgi:hypothetical protein
MKIAGYVFVILIFAACNNKNTSVKSAAIIDSLTDENIVDVSRDNPDLYLDNEKKFSDSSGLKITIQNSLPKGGPYYNPSGALFGCVVFWSRFINESAKPIELTINFPADSFMVFNSTDAYLKLLLPTDTMSLEKVGLYNYGATGLQTFLESNMHEETGLNQIIQPSDDFIFYTAALCYKEGGVVRSGFEIVNCDVIFSISITPQFEILE